MFFFFSEKRLDFHRLYHTNTLEIQFRFLMRNAKIRQGKLIFPANKTSFYCFYWRELIQSLFLSVFSRILTEYEDLLSKSSYSVQLSENKDQKNYGFGHFLLSYRHAGFYLVRKLHILSKSWIYWQDNVLNAWMFYKVSIKTSY